LAGLYVNQPFEIQGRLSGKSYGKIYLFFENHYRQKDSLSSAIVDGKFHFSDKVALPILCRVHMDQTSYIEDFYIDSKVTRIDCVNELELVKREGAAQDTINKLKIVSIQGSAIEPPKMAFERFIAQLKQSKLGGEEKSRQHADSLKAFIAHHPGSKASAYLLGKVSDLRYAEVKGLLEMIDSSLSNTYEYRVAANEIGRLHRVERLAAGGLFHDVILHDTAGRSIDSRQFRGNYLLVEFWASWCGPCMASIPSVRSLYEKNKGQHFVILGVSWDYTHDRWKNAIIKTGMPWPQVIDRVNSEDGLAHYYGLEAVPTNILLDPSGKILGHDLSMEDVQKFLPWTEGHKTAAR
jgi:thiol-disulfide isomerase/thioredoxin